MIVALVQIGCEEDSTPSGNNSSGISVSAPPFPNLEGAEDPVAEKIRRVALQVRGNEGAAEAWGHYGVVLEAHGFDEDALVCYRKATELDPDQDRWHYLLALRLSGQDLEVSLLSFERAIEIDPHSTLFRNAYGDALLRLGREDEARSQFEEVLTIDSSARRAWLGLGELALRRGETEEALERLNHASEIDFFDREVHAKLARVYRRLGENERAGREMLYTKAYPRLSVVIDPHRALIEREAVSAKALTRRGLIFVRLGRFADAERIFRQALHQRPDSIRNQMNLAGVLVKEGRVEEAIGMYRRTMVSAPDDAEVCHNYGVALIELKQLHEAERLLRRAIELDPSRDLSYVNLGRIEEKRDLREAARVSYERAIFLNPVNALAHQRLAILLGASGHPQQALEHWREAVAFGGRDPQAAVNLAMSAAQLGRFGEALGVLRRGLHLTPDHVPLLAALVTILATCPDAEHRDGIEAVRWGRRLMEKTGSGHIPSLNLLAAAQAEAGDFGEAVRISKRALVAARKVNQGRMVELTESRLALYEAGRPYHQSMP